MVCWLGNVAWIIVALWTIVGVDVLTRLALDITNQA